MVTSWMACGSTYSVKDQLKAMGGRWDKERRVWRFATEPNAVTGVVFVPDPKPEGWFVFDCMREIEPGKVFLRPLALRKDQQDDFRVCVAQWTDKRWDDDRERHVDCLMTLSRPLTDEEWAATSAKFAAIDSAREAKIAAKDELFKAIKAASVDEKIESIVGRTVRFPHRSQDDFAVLSDAKAYFGFWNGASGDDWSRNNWNDCVVYVANRTPEIDVAFEVAVKHYGEK